MTVGRFRRLRRQQRGRSSSSSSFIHPPPPRGNSSHSCRVISMNDSTLPHELFRRTLGGKSAFVTLNEEDSGWTFSREKMHLNLLQLQNPKQNRRVLDFDPVLTRSLLCFGTPNAIQEVKSHFMNVLMIHTFHPTGNALWSILTNQESIDAH